MRYLKRQWSKGILGIAALALLLFLIYLLTAGWLELAIVAIAAFTLGRFSTKLPGLSGAKATNITENRTTTKRQVSAAATQEPPAEKTELDHVLREETTELGYEEIDADELAARIQREVENRQRDYDPTADLTARREKLARRKP